MQQAAESLSVELQDAKQHIAIKLVNSQMQIYATNHVDVSVLQVSRWLARCCIISSSCQQQLCSICSLFSRQQLIPDMSANYLQSQQALAAFGL